MAASGETAQGGREDPGPCRRAGRRHWIGRWRLSGDSTAVHHRYPSETPCQCRAATGAPSACSRRPDRRFLTDPAAASLNDWDAYELPPPIEDLDTRFFVSDATGRMQG